jgi:hypothetical protein
MEGDGLVEIIFELQIGEGGWEVVYGKVEREAYAEVGEGGRKVHRHVISIDG